MLKLKSRFFLIVLIFAIVAITCYLMSVFFLKPFKIYFEVGLIVSISAIFISLFQKQVIAISFDEINHLVEIQEYRPFIRSTNYITSMKYLKVSCKKEHIARGNYARVLRIFNPETNDEYKISEQMSWWEPNTVDQILEQFQKAGVSIN
jgi:hypothetical protein